MNQHLLVHAATRDRHSDTRKLTRRRENLTLFKRELREARRRRTRELINRPLNALGTFRATRVAAGRSGLVAEEFYGVEEGS
jgi:hypothetical protein